MSNTGNEALFLLKDVKPGSKNLNIVFIVLEIGKLLYMTNVMSCDASCNLSLPSLKGPIVHSCLPHSTVLRWHKVNFVFRYFQNIIHKLMEIWTTLQELDV